MSKFMVTLPPLPEGEVPKTWTAVLTAARDSSLTMERAYVSDSGQAVCIWDAPDLKAVESLFEKAAVTTESISVVEEYIKP